MAGDRGPEIEGAVVAKRMAVLRPHLIDGVPLARVAADAGIPIRTARRWIARYRADGPAELKGLRRALLQGNIHIPEPRSVGRFIINYLFYPGSPSGRGMAQSIQPQRVV